MFYGAFLMEMSNSGAVRLTKKKPRSLLTFNVSWRFKLAVGSKLLMVNSGEPPDRNVICVAMIEDYFRDFLSILFDGNVKFQCCEMSKEDVQVSG